MDPALAGFLGGLIPSAVAFPIARYQVHAASKHSNGEIYAMFADATDRYVAVCEDLVEFQAEGRLTRAETGELTARFEQLKAEAAHSAPHVVLDEMEQIADEAKDVGERYQRTAESMLARIDAQASDLGLIRRRMTIFASDMLRRLADDIDAHLIELVRALHRRDDEGRFQELRADIANLLDGFLEEAAKETGRSRFRQLRERSPRLADSRGSAGSETPG